MKLLSYSKYGKSSGIYLIRNILNNKVYVGSSKRIYFRISWHINALKNNNHHNQHLQNAWNKYGENNFEVEILEITSDLLKREGFFMEKYKSNNKEKGYNITDYQRGRSVMSKETRLKISNKMKGRTPFKAIEKQKENFLNGKPHHSLGKELSKETKDKIKLSRSLWSKEKKEKIYNKILQTLKNHRKDRSKECLVKDSNGLIIDKFKSVKECYEKYNYYSYSHLLKIFRGTQKNKFYKDLFFSYLN